jgi:hypothetical protein
VEFDIQISQFANPGEIPESGISGAISPFGRLPQILPGALQLLIALRCLRLTFSNPRSAVRNSHPSFRRE